MNAYELVRPDGSGSGIWECGECHTPHAGVTRGGKPDSQWNREAAEKCCVPPICRYCGQPTERDSSGRFPFWHERCLPKFEPEPPHPSMANPNARLLYEKMAALSEAGFFAGWIMGNEYSLWEILQGGKPAEYGITRISAEDLEELRALSQQAGGWIWTGPARTFTPQLVPFDRWPEILANAPQELISEIRADVEDLEGLQDPED